MGHDASPVRYPRKDFTADANAQRLGGLLYGKLISEDNLSELDAKCVVSSLLGGAQRKP